MIGQTIAHYTILEKLGEGGMGVVYKARDTKLNRDVALKFLPPQLAASESDRARFVQEAQSAAALNHPNVCSVIDIQEYDDPSGGEKQMFMVMEFVDGQTLRDKLEANAAGTALPLKQAVEIGVQAAEGLAAAHEKGIVHRDIKPENIMIRRDGIAQIMDFGLAKLRTSTKTRLTKAGSTIGTVGYMSPEQVQGQETDQRSDIFSLGVVLFELFTGQPPFRGMHETAVAYEVVNVDSPPMSSVNPSIPPELDAIVLDCLEKDPRERTQAAGQVALELKRYRRESSRQRASRITAARPVQGVSPGAGSDDRLPAGASPAEASPHAPVRSEPGRGRRISRVVVTGIVACAAMIAGYFVGMYRTDSVPGPGLVRTSIELPKDLTIPPWGGGHEVISPDGRRIAFVGLDAQEHETLYIRELASTEPVRLPGTEDAEYPFWSPDSRSLGFFADGKLKRVDISGSPPLTLADAPAGRGGAWSPEGVIIFTPDRYGKDMFQVPAAGGTPVPVTDHDSAAGISPRFPVFLPDGRHFLYVTMLSAPNTAEDRDDYQAWIGSLDEASVEFPLRGTSNVWYASGHLLYLRKNTLIAQPFDPGSRTLNGDPAPIGTGINFFPARAKGDFSVSGNGVIVYRPQVRQALRQIVLRDRRGSEKLVAGGEVFQGVLSPDGRNIVFVDRGKEQGNSDLWIYDDTRGIRTRFTFDSVNTFSPLWSPDGSCIYFSKNNDARTGRERGIYRKFLDGSEEVHPVAVLPGEELSPEDISPDGRFLLIGRYSDSTKADIWQMDLSGDGAPGPLLQTRFGEASPRFSPDGRWYLYRSNESGQWALYLRPFNRPGGKWQVSGEDGGRAVWVKTGEILYESRESQMAITVSTKSERPEFGTPSVLFSGNNDTNMVVLDASADGQRMVVYKYSRISNTGSMQLIMDWPSMVRREGRE